MKKFNKKGFTLIEMLAVIAIIAVLVAIIVPAVGSSTIKAKASTDAANLRSALSAATIQYASEGSVTAADIKVPASKVDSDYKYVLIYKNGDALEAYYTTAGTGATTGMSIAELSTIAETGNATEGTHYAKATLPATTGTNPPATLVATITCG